MESFGRASIFHEMFHDRFMSLSFVQEGFTICWLFPASFMGCLVIPWTFHHFYVISGKFHEVLLLLQGYFLQLSLLHECFATSSEFHGFPSVCRSFWTEFHELLLSFFRKCLWIFVVSWDLMCCCCNVAWLLGFFSCLMWCHAKIHDFMTF